MKNDIFELSVENTSEKASEFRAMIDNIEKSIRNSSLHLSNSTLSHGLLGASLFYFYYACYTNKNQNYIQAEKFLIQTIEYSGYKDYKHKYPTDSYDANLAVLGIFLIKAMENDLLSFDVSPYILNIEEILYELCKNKLKYADFSIFSGALATGNFLLRAKPSKRNNQFLGEIVEAIGVNAISDSSGDLCWTSPRLKDRVYLGLSHGSCMIISFLSDVYQRGIAQEKCQLIIDKAISFVLKHKSDSIGGLFPHYLGAGKQGPQFTLCYGDLGVGYGLLKGSLLLEDQVFIDQSKGVIDICSNIKFEDNLTFDASITYGASGIAYLYEKLYKLDASDANHFKSYLYWIKQIPKYCRKNNDFCGYQSFFSPESNVFNLSYDWGIIGIGITLMRYLDERLPNMEGITRGL